MDYSNYYEEIKKQLIKNEIYKKAKDYSKNLHDLETYYNVGKLLVDAQGGANYAKYGNKLIKEYSKRLTNELGIGYGWRSLYNMRQYYIMLNENEILQASPAISWSHWCELIKLDDINAINYYIDITIKQNLSYRKLGEKIKLKEYERLDNKTKVNK